MSFLNSRMLFELPVNEVRWVDRFYQSPSGARPCTPCDRPASVNPRIPEVLLRTAPGTRCLPRVGGCLPPRTDAPQGSSCARRPLAPPAPSGWDATRSSLTQYRTSVLLLQQVVSRTGTVLRPADITACKLRANSLRCDAPGSGLYFQENRTNLSKVHK